MGKDFFGYSRSVQDAITLVPDYDVCAMFTRDFNIDAQITLVVRSGLPKPVFKAYRKLLRACMKHGVDLNMFAHPDDLMRGRGSEIHGSA